MSEVLADFERAFGVGDGAERMLKGFYLITVVAMRPLKSVSRVLFEAISPTLKLRSDHDDPSPPRGCDPSLWGKIKPELIGQIGDKLPKLNEQDKCKACVHNFGVLSNLHTEGALASHNVSGCNWLNLPSPWEVAKAFGSNLGAGARTGKTGPEDFPVDFFYLVLRYFLPASEVFQGDERRETFSKALETLRDCRNDRVMHPKGDDDAPASMSEDGLEEVRDAVLEVLRQLEELVDAWKGCDRIPFPKGCTDSIAEAKALVTVVMKRAPLSSGESALVKTVLTEIASLRDELALERRSGVASLPTPEKVLAAIDATPLKGDVGGATQGPLFLRPWIAGEVHTRQGGDKPVVLLRGRSGDGTSTAAKQLRSIAHRKLAAFGTSAPLAVLCATLSASMCPTTAQHYVIDHVVAQLARDPCGDPTREPEAREIVCSMLSRSSAAGMLTHEQLALHPQYRKKLPTVPWRDVLNEVVLPALASPDGSTLRDVIIVLRDDECGFSVAKFLSCVEHDVLFRSRVRFVVACSSSNGTSSIAERWLKRWLRTAKLSDGDVRSVSLSTERGEHSPNAEHCLDDVRHLAREMLSDAPKTAEKIIKRVAVPGVMIETMTKICARLAREANNAGGGASDKDIEALLMDAYERRLQACEERRGNLPKGVVCDTAALIAAATFVRARLDRNDVAQVLTNDDVDQVLTNIGPIYRPTEDADDDSIVDPTSTVKHAIRIVLDAHVAVVGDQDQNVICPPDDAATFIAYWRSNGDCHPRGDGKRRIFRRCLAAIARFAAASVEPDRTCCDREVLRISLIHVGMTALNSSDVAVAGAFKKVCSSEQGLSDVRSSLLSLLDDAHKHHRVHPEEPLVPCNADQAEEALCWILEQAEEHAANLNATGGGEGGDGFLDELLGCHLPREEKLDGDSECDRYMETLLCAAAHAGCAKVVEKILKMARTDPTGGTFGKATGPCGRAIGAPGSVLVLKNIREFGKRQSTKPASEWCRLPTSVLHIAAERGDLEALEWILKGMEEDRAKAQKATDDVNLLQPFVPLAMPLPLGRGFNAVDNPSRSAPLHIACARGDHGAVELLLCHGADPTAKDSRGRTPLHFAAGARNSNIVRSLVDWAQRMPEPLATPDFLSAVDGDEWTPLHVAVARGAADFCAAVRNSLNSSDATSWRNIVCKGHRYRPSPLHLAAITSGAGSGDVVRELLKPTAGELESACGTSHVRACLDARFAMKVKGGDVSWTMLHMAAVANNALAVEAVAEALQDFPQEDWNDLRELWDRPSGISPLHAAFYANAISAVKPFLAGEWPWSGNQRCAKGLSPVEYALLGARDRNTELWNIGRRMDGADCERSSVRAAAEEDMDALLRLHHARHDKDGGEAGSDPCAFGGKVPLVSFAARLGLVGAIRLLIDSHDAVMTVADVLDAVPYICAKRSQCTRNTCVANTRHSTVEPEAMAVDTGPDPIPDLLGLAGGRSLPSLDRNAVLAAAVRHGCSRTTVVALVEEYGADPCGMVPPMPVVLDQDDFKDSCSHASVDTETVVTKVLPSALSSDGTSVKGKDALAVQDLRTFIVRYSHLDAARDPVVPNEPSTPPAAQGEEGKNTPLLSEPRRLVMSEAISPASRTMSGSSLASNDSSLGHQPGAPDPRASRKLPGSPILVDTRRRPCKHVAGDECSGLLELAERCVAGVEDAVDTISDAIAVCVNENKSSLRRDVTCLAQALARRDTLDLVRLLCGPDLGDTNFCSRVARVAGTMLSSSAITSLVRAAEQCECDPRASPAFVTAAVRSAVVAKNSNFNKFKDFFQELQSGEVCSLEAEVELTHDIRLNAPVPVHPASVLKVAFDAALARGMLEMAVGVSERLLIPDTTLDLHVKEWCFQRTIERSHEMPEITYDTLCGILNNFSNEESARELARNAMKRVISQRRDGDDSVSAMPIVRACLGVLSSDADSQRVGPDHGFLLAHDAARLGQVDVLELFAKRAHQRCSYDRSHDPTDCPWASLWGRSGADGPVRGRGLTVLHLAAQYHQVEAVNFLLSDIARPSYGCCPVADAADINTIALAGPSTNKHIYATTPLGYAVMRPKTGKAKDAQKDVVAALINNGAWLGPYLSPLTAEETPGVTMTGARGAEETNLSLVVGPASIAAWSNDYDSLDAMLQPMLVPHVQPESVIADVGVSPPCVRNYICPVHCLCARGDINKALELIRAPGLRTVFWNGALASACALPDLNDKDSHLLPTFKSLPCESAIHTASRNRLVSGNDIERLCETVPVDNRERSISARKNSGTGGPPLTPLGAAVACGNLEAARVLFKLRERALKDQPECFSEVDSGATLVSLAQDHAMQDLLAPLSPRRAECYHLNNARPSAVGALYYYIEREKSDSKVKVLPARTNKSDDPEWSISREHISLVFHFAYVSNGLEDVSVNSVKLVLSDPHLEVGLERENECDGFRAFALGLSEVTNGCAGDIMMRDTGHKCKGNLHLRCRTSAHGQSSYFELQVPISFRGKKPKTATARFSRRVADLNPFANFEVQGASSQGIKIRERAIALSRKHCVASLVIHKE